MNKLVIAFGLSMIPFLACSTNACECVIHGDGSPRTESHHSKLVFVGEVTNIREATQYELHQGSLSHAVTFRVERYWKGIQTNQVTVYAELAGCPPLSVEKGQKYLVYAQGRQLRITCTRTRKLDAADEDLKALGKGKELNFAEPKK